MGLGACGGTRALLAEQVLNLLPLVLAGADFLLVLDLAQVGGVGQQVM